MPGISPPRPRGREKDLARSYESLVSDWRELSYRLGVSDARLASLTGRTQPPDLPADKWAERALGKAGILARRRLQPGARLSGLVARRCLWAPMWPRSSRDVEALVAQGRLVRVAQSESPLLHGGLKASSGRRIPAGVAEATYTTPEILALHDHLGELVSNYPGAVGLVAYEPSERLDALDKLGDLVSEPERLVTAIAPGRVAAASFEAVTGIETVPVAQFDLSHTKRHEGAGNSLLVLAEAHRLGPWEFASALEVNAGER